MGNTSSSSIGTFASDYAKGKSLLSMIIGIPLTLLFIGVSIYFLINSNKYAPVNATIIDNLCTTIQNKINCTNTLQYTVGSKTYTKSNVFTNFPTIKGSILEIYYEVDNPGDISLFGFPSFIGWIMLGISSLALLGIIINYYLVNSYQGYAEGQGAIDITSDILNVIKK